MSCISCIKISRIPKELLQICLDVIIPQQRNLLNKRNCSYNNKINCNKYQKYHELPVLYILF